MKKLICFMIALTALMSLILQSNLPALQTENRMHLSDSSLRNNNSGSDSYAENVHMYICIQALQLLKDKFPDYNYTEFDTHIGTVNDCGDRPWQTSLATTGACREDREDVVFDIRGPFGFYASNSHFWNADNRTDGDNSLTTLNILGINSEYPNAYTKLQRYIDGQWYKWNGSGYGQKTYIIYNTGDGTFYFYRYTRGLIDFYKTNRIWLECTYNIEGRYTEIRREVTVSNSIKVKFVWEILGRMAHLVQDNTVPAHTHNDVHVREWDGGDCYHNHIDDGAYQEFTWQTAKDNGGFINPYTDFNDPVRYIMYTANQLADHYPSGPDCEEIPQQHSGDNDLPGGTNAMINNYYQMLGPSPQNITDVHEEGRNCMNHAIRATCALFYWFGVETGLISTDPLAFPVINNFSKNLPDNSIFRGETMTFNCSASGPDLTYEWFVKVCDSSNRCLETIPGLSYRQEGNRFYIRNINFKNRWSCSRYDSLCNPKNSVSLYEEPLYFLVGVKASNRFGYTTKYFNFNSQNFFYPNEHLRPPPPPPISGCPFILNNNGSQYVFENNILKTSQFFCNEDKSVEDKIILKSRPYINPSDKLITVAIKEINSDSEKIDRVRLFAVDHPANEMLGITENNDPVLYDPEEIISPNFAELSGKDVTKLLEYDDDYFNKAEGNISDMLNLNFSETCLTHSSGAGDSIALILDPDPPSKDIRDPAVKDISGYLTAKDTDGNTKPDKVRYGMRQLRSELIIPLFKDKSVQSAEFSWQRNFELSYAGIVQVKYSGFNSYELPLSSAEDLKTGDIRDKLLIEDNDCSELDSSSFIELNFEYIPAEIPQGWVRDYIFCVNGKITKQSGSNKSLHSNKTEKNGTEVNVQIKNKLFSNFPNPFNPNTVIRYSISEKNFVTIKIYDILGKEVTSLVNKVQDAGNYSAQFNAQDLPSGVYFYRIFSGDYNEIRKMTLIR